jgi:hypothetical protein
MLVRDGPGRRAQRISTPHPPGNQASQEAGRVTTGLILLVLVAALVTYGYTRMRRRMGMAVTGRHWLTAMTATILAVLALWAYSTHR